ncbi:MAG: DUF962 domain-containing protein [Planctomycetota bacterium]
MQSSAEQGSDRLKPDDAPRQFQSFQEFWPYYVGEHRHPACRALHYLGAIALIGLLTTSLITREICWFLAIPFASYGLAWTGHFFIEKNRPATWGYILYSLRGEFRMFRFFLMGKMRGELIRIYGCPHPDRDQQQLVEC